MKVKQVFALPDIFGFPHPTYQVNGMETSKYSFFL